ncbi:transcription/translation regulatory transformer protein RfaH [Porticoccaceae bacterium]|jgi:transcriptional antiterminator RfaH|nr:transcription/translation regulatory transformer protein RfaH [Porticoccaceae bacterium]
MESWFLLQTKSKQEGRAVENLERQGVNSFCPMIQVEKLSRGSRVVKAEALFPGYLFVNFDQSSVSSTTVRSTRGVSHFVTSAGLPVKVPESLINHLMLRTDPDNEEMLSSLPSKGDSLKIVNGPFRGLDAVFSQPDGDQRAIVLINLLNQQVSASLPFASLVAGS